MWRWMAAMTVLLVCAWPARAEQDPVHAAADEMFAALGERRLLLVDELHGTQEAPRLVAAVVERLSAAGAVTLGMEIMAEDAETAAIARYLDSAGSAADRAALAATPFWGIASERNDGRRTEDLIDLVDAVRRLRAQGRDVTVVPFDAVLATWRRGGSEAREEEMALRLRAAADAMPQGRVVALTGNLHAMHRKRDPAQSGLPEPIGARLRDLEPFSVNVSASDGEAWNCRAGSCGRYPARSRDAHGPMDADAPFHHQIVLPRFTAARPVGAAAPMQEH
ncbi:calcium-binding protein [Xanthomonas sp. XNM01]|uniref:calcium-binding protein n=1 Tax=Xanthomonas sp. XNM01 TaxID=2769289 RepID=UPI00177BDA64|nr:calcium-binding protein [Xanthomonas sp. XNM01]MBD9369895.1 calcium-binding protein [Xanthomonas sp. XNM01]